MRMTESCGKCVCVCVCALCVDLKNAMGASASQPVVGVTTNGWPLLADAQKEPEPIKPAPKSEAPKSEAPKSEAPKSEPPTMFETPKTAAPRPNAPPMYKTTFASWHTMYQGGIVDDSKNMIYAWNFLRKNPLTGGHFNPIAHMLHPCAIGESEARHLLFYAGEIRQMLLTTRKEAPGPLDMENPVHEHSIAVLDSFQAFCALHVACNRAALETYRKHQDEKPMLDFASLMP